MKRKRRVGITVWLLAIAAFAGLIWLWLGSSPQLLQHRPRADVAVPATTNLHREAISDPTTQPNGPSTSEVKPAPRVHEIAARTHQHPSAVVSADRASPASENNTAENLPIGYPRPVQNVFEMQVALGRLALCCGSIDGVMGPQTRLALLCYQRQSGLIPSGELDAPTREHLLLSEAPTRTYVVTSNDLARLQPLSPTWLGKSQQSALDYETILELVAEESHSSPATVRRLNPHLQWSNVCDSSRLELPSVIYPEVKGRAAWITIQLKEKTLEAWDSQTNVLAHFPCSIARQVEKRPIGELHVSVVAPNPNYTFNPEIFPESAEAQELHTKLVLPPVLTTQWESHG